MAPATHSCEPPSNITIVARSNPERQQDFVGSNLLSMVPVPAAGTTVTSEADAEDAGNLTKEPVFVAALVLTFLILLGGVIVMKLSKTPLPKRDPAKKSSRFTSNEVSSTPSPEYGITVVEPDFESPKELVESSPGTSRTYLRQLGVTPHIVLSEPDEDAFGNQREEFATAEGMTSDGQPSRRDEWARPGQGDSNVSESMEEMEIIPVDHVFSESVSSISSITSHSETASDDEEHYGCGDDGDQETTFEVKRGHAQSIELMKGVLMNWPATGESSKSVGLERTKAKEPPVPALIVTQPSMLSLFTMDSSASNMTVDLGQFPLPPLHLEPAVFWRKLEEEINTNLALKRQSNL